MTGFASRALAPSAPNQDDAAGNERQSTIDEAVNSVQAVPLEDMEQTHSQVQKPDKHRNRAESGAERRAGSFVHWIPLSNRRRKGGLDSAHLL
jgi:hypothetical protein